MNPTEKTLSIAASALLMVAVFSISKPSSLCFISASSALVLSIYLRRRGAFRGDNTPLLGAFLIGGSSMMALAGLFFVSPMALLVVAGAILIPIALFLLAFGIRERAKSFLRWADQKMRDAEKPPR